MEKDLGECLGKCVFGRRRSCYLRPAPMGHRSHTYTLVRMQKTNFCQFFQVHWRMFYDPALWFHDDVTQVLKHLNRHMHCIERQKEAGHPSAPLDSRSSLTLPALHTHSWQLAVYWTLYQLYKVRSEMKGIFLNLCWFSESNITTLF